ncbi:AAA family ATPase [Photobacterium alginatilyticum]|uniref:AAA family ATPase n=1 Tax=Photobacterium alginatilyticum TaxID=1775171 RepID=UPI0040698C49
MDMQNTTHTGLAFHQQPQRGKRIAVASAKGGAGTTSLVANIAWGLAKRPDANVACADLDFITGDLDLQLSFKSNNALLEMLQYPERLEPVVYERSGVKVTGNLSAFTGYQAKLEQAFWPELNEFEHFSAFCQQQAAYLVWDIPAFCLRDQVGFGALHSSDIRVVIVEPTLASIRRTNLLLAELDNAAGQQTLLVLNHTKPESASLITAEDVAKAVGRKPDVEIPYSPDHMVASTTLGQLAIAQKSRAAKALNQLVALIQGEQAGKRSGLFGWLKGA